MSIPLTNAVDKAMAKYPKARRIAVENFTSSCGDQGMHNALNLQADRKAYNWTQQTVDAIKLAVRLLGKPI